MIIYFVSARQNMSATAEAFHVSVQGLQRTYPNIEMMTPVFYNGIVTTILMKMRNTSQLTAIEDALKAIYPGVELSFTFF